MLYLSDFRLDSGINW